jgi:large subunit ribosomal protein L10
LNRDDKGKIVSDLQQQMSGAKVAILTRFVGLSVGRMTQLRRELRKAAVEYRVVKNTLFRLAIQNTDKKVLEAQLEGPIGVAWSNSDVVAPARILAKFAKEFPELQIMMACSDGKVFGPAQIQSWVNLPSLEGLQARILGFIQTPATQLVRLLVTPSTRLAQVLKAKSEQKQ